MRKKIAALLAASIVLAGVGIHELKLENSGRNHCGINNFSRRKQIS